MFLQLHTEPQTRACLILRATTCSTSTHTHRLFLVSAAAYSRLLEYGCTHDREAAACLSAETGGTLHAHPGRSVVLRTSPAFARLRQTDPTAASDAPKEEYVENVDEGAAKPIAKGAQAQNVRRLLKRCEKRGQPLRRSSLFFATTYLGLSGKQAMRYIDRVRANLHANRVRAALNVSFFG